LERIIEGNDKGAIELLNDYRRKSEPMKVIINGRYHEDPAEVACELESAPFGV